MVHSCVMTLSVFIDLCDLENQSIEQWKRRTLLCELFKQSIHDIVFQTIGLCYFIVGFNVSLSEGNCQGPLDIIRYSNCILLIHYLTINL